MHKGEGDQSQKLAKRAKIMPLWIRPLFPIAMATEVVLWCHWSEQQIGDKNLISSLHDSLSVKLIKPEDMIKTIWSML